MKYLYQESIPIIFFSAISVSSFLSFSSTLSTFVISGNVNSSNSSFFTSLSSIINSLISLIGFNIFSSLVLSS